jgi:hypothetical protein
VQIDVWWSDNLMFGKPVTDQGGATLPAGSNIQVGYFAGIPPADPDSFGTEEWANFIPLTGDGSLNAVAFPATISSEVPGFFTFPILLNDKIHQGIPDFAVLIGIRFFDQQSVANRASCTSSRASPSSRTKVRA